MVAIIEQSCPSFMQVKSVDLVSAYIRRIREVQAIINAVVEERFEEALKDAAEVDKLVASGSMSASQMIEEKPLLGLPFTSKNSIAIRGYLAIPENQERIHC
ncbi:hypothetical protein HPB51_005602 [Rhipicephalus microplus]|uniref:Amidase domain-containing protein n=1 Tax=Rhipicephalus microplus TaxID=6941 RepID=A0A9J6DSY1_RHIMP|nr:hypothetical protein HPB51_005602 [Rhipicephalus microplus]